MRRDLSLKGKLIAGASACLVLAMAMWVVLFLSNGRVETRLETSKRDLDRVSGLRALNTQYLYCHFEMVVGVDFFYNPGSVENVDGNAGQRGKSIL